MGSNRKRFVLAYDVSYPGDFFMSGRWWRAVRVVEAVSAQDALTENKLTKDLPEDCVILVATTYPPALDIVESRERNRIFS